MTNPIPAGYHTATPSLTFKNTEKALAFYQKAFAAKAADIFRGLDGKGIMHATIQIGDSIIMMGDEMGPHKSAESLGQSPMSLYLYVKDADALYNQAVAAGAKAVMPMEEMFWGDRAGTVQDPFGYQWMIATHKRDLTPEQIRQEAEAFFARFAQK